MNSARNRRILVVDDNQSIHDDFRKILGTRDPGESLRNMEGSIFGKDDPATAKRAPATEPCELASALQGEEAYQVVLQSVAEDRRFALAFIDMRMPPGWDGLKTIEKLWEADSELQVVICTAYSDYSWQEIHQRFGACDRLLILKKPFDTLEVCQLVSSLTEKWHLGRQAHLKLTQMREMVHEQTRELENTNQKLVEEIEQRKNSEERYRLAETGANDGLWDWDLLSGQVYYSSRWKTILGCAEDEISDSPGEWYSRVHADDLDRLKEDQRRHFEGESEQLRGEYRVRHADGRYLWILCRGVAVRDADGRAIRAAGSFSDITDRKVAEDQMRFDSQHDSLTGMANRAQLIERLGHCMARSRRDATFRFAVMFMDLDHFKVINDSLGHGVGDRLLVEVGMRLTACAREIDTLARPGIDQVARIGGDEFVLLLEGIGGDADALRVANRVHEALAKPFDLEGHEVCTFVSIGVTVSRGSYERADDILRDADTALYQAKGAGKACTRMFDPEMHERAMMRLRIETELRQAIDQDQLVLHYQPIMTGDGRLASLEALIRWQHPHRGLLQPGAFIPMIEESGMIVPVGKWVMRAACRQLQAWRAQFPGQRYLSVGVNVSSRQLATPGLADDVADILSETALPASCLHLEVTESAAMRNVEETLKTLARLNAVGTQIDVDDFGTGYSSLSYLHRLPINALKIDRGFIGPMCRDTMSRSIVQAIIALAHSLNLAVIAEGVETESHLEAVRSLDCDFVQGFYISRPIPADEATSFIAKHTVVRKAG